jgi:hypothetical protein
MACLRSGASSVTPTPLDSPLAALLAGGVPIDPDEVRVGLVQDGPIPGLRSLCSSGDPIDVSKKVAVDTVDQPQAQGAPTAALVTLEGSVVEEIEGLHRQVMRDRAAGRFGLLPESSPTQLKDAEAAEQALLAKHGFASYDDFNGRTGGSTAMVQPDDSQAVALPGCEAGLAPRSPQMPMGPDAGDRIESLRALVQARADELVDELNADLERRIALILERGSDEFAEIMQRLAEGREAVRALFVGSSSLTPAPGAGPPGPVAEDGARTGTTALRRELGELSRGDPAPTV